MNVPFLDVRAAYLELKPAIDDAVGRVLDSGWYILGDEVEKFEAAFADYCETSFCIGVGNGLDALVLALRALDIGTGDEVIVPANTYIATWLAVSAVGATCVPVEPEANGCNIDCNRIEAVISARTRAILPVHLFGHPADMISIRKIADRHNLKIVADCAQAHGARWQNESVGASADIGTFSFYPGKNLGAMGDGGAVVTSDPQLAKRIRLLGNYGSSQKYLHTEKGANSRLDPVQAAILGVKLDSLDEWNLRRQRIADRYVESLSALPVKLIRAPDNATSVWHIFAVQSPHRDQLMAYLAQQGIATLIHYPQPPHLSGAYQGEFVSHPVHLPITEQKAAEFLSLPMGPHLSAEEQDHVIHQVRGFFDQRTHP